jgi:hypothetical protein
MPLTTQQKSYLADKRDEIKVVFNRHKALKTYMGVYFNTRNFQPFITFSNSNDFRPVLKMAGNTNEFCCTYACALDFDDQTDVLLA